MVACSDSRHNINPLVALCLGRPHSFVGNTEIDVDIKKYYCRAGIKSIQVRLRCCDWGRLINSWTTWNLNKRRWSRNRNININWYTETLRQMWTFKGGRPRSFDRDRCNDPRPLRRHFYIMCWHRTDRGDVICSAVSGRIRPCLLFRDQRKWVEGNS